MADQDLVRSTPLPVPCHYPQVPVADQDLVRSTPHPLAWHKAFGRSERLASAQNIYYTDGGALGAEELPRANVRSEVKAEDMSRYLQGDEGFEYKYITVRRDLPIERLAHVAGSGTVRLVVDHYHVRTEDGESQMVFLGGIEQMLGLPHDDDRGFYEDVDGDDTAAQLFKRLVATERKVTVPAFRKRFAKSGLASLDVVANTQYQLYKDSDWDTMLAYLNSHLPKGAELTYEELQTFSSAILEEFDPELHEPNRENGTGFLMHFLQSEADDCLPYLGFRILVHAVECDLEEMNVEDEPRWQSTIWSAEESPRKGKAKTASKGGAGTKKAPKKEA